MEIQGLGSRGPTLAAKHHHVGTRRKELDSWLEKDTISTGWEGTWENWTWGFDGGRTRVERRDSVKKKKDKGPISDFRKIGKVQSQGGKKRERKLNKENENWATYKGGASKREK